MTFSEYVAGKNLANLVILYVLEDGNREAIKYERISGFAGIAKADSKIPGEVREDGKLYLLGGLDLLGAAFYGNRVTDLVVYEDAEEVERLTAEDAEIRESGLTMSF